MKTLVTGFQTTKFPSTPFKLRNGPNRGKGTWKGRGNSGGRGGSVGRGLHQQPQLQGQPLPPSSRPTSKRTNPQENTLDPDPQI